MAKDIKPVEKTDEQKAMELLGLSESSEAQEYIAAAKSALRSAQTPGDVVRIQRMLRQKLRVLKSLEWMGDRQ